MPSTKAPKFVLTANDHEDKDKQIANLKAMVDEREKVVKATMKENEELKGTKNDDDNDDNTPAIKAKLQAMHDEEKDETKKAAIKATLNVFDKGHGSKTGSSEDEDEDAPNKKVIEAAVARAIKPFQDKEIQPIIAKILTANQVGGASEEQMAQLTKSLTAKTYDEIIQYANENSVLIANALKSENESVSTEALTASIESSLPFNGEIQGFALTGKSVSIDDTLEGVTI